MISEVGTHVQLTVRVFADGGVNALGGLVGAGQARPTWLSTLARDCRLVASWGETTPVCLDEQNIGEFVGDVLFADSREWPVIVLSAFEQGGYVVPPEALADELLGLARVYYLGNHATSFRLTDLLGGKELSCFWGATRVYLPRFSCADPGLEHPLLFPDDLLDPASRAELVGELAVGLRSSVPIAEGIAARRARRSRPRSVTSAVGTPAIGASEASPSAPAVTTPDKNSSEDEANSPQPQSPTPLSAPADSSVATPGNAAADAIAAAIGAVAAQLEVLAGAITNLTAANRELFDEVAQLRTGSAVRLASIASIERRIERIDTFMLNEVPRLLARSPEGAPDIESEQEERTALIDIVRQASARHTDALLFLESAEGSAIDSPYEDVDRVAKVLDAMADIARRRQHGTLGLPVRQAFRDYGIDYRSTISETTPGKQRAQYQLADRSGQIYACLEHIVLGSSHDPRYCLRIYFTSRAPLEPRFVIGHVGRHFDVITTS